ncbi:MAG TPA: GNAT family N-acetyltransferase [Microscillaceae bacterium]|nr:GNAT family N-acetyltransferase [Microscillaceae bacterium]
MSHTFTIREGTIAEVVALSQQIPEFSISYAAEEYHKRLKSARHLILIAVDHQTPVGFKVGYQSADPTIFYSWMGGILPSHRRQKIAQHLATYQEKWVKENGFTHIRFKTRNYLKPMLIFGINNGFDIVEVIPKESVSNYRIILEKQL